MVSTLVSPLLLIVTSPSLSILMLNDISYDKSCRYREYILVLMRRNNEFSQAHRCLKKEKKKKTFESFDYTYIIIKYTFLTRNILVKASIHAFNLFISIRPEIDRTCRRSKTTDFYDQTNYPGQIQFYSKKL
uniref:Uncharacterized protein n=1 Tax=Cacopsylla melanoneura TaxID=428564 RepID=A0A8D8S8N1_9HEMI